MKWRILLELTETTGSVETREMVTGDRPTNVISPESIGLSLAESKSILAAIKTQLVRDRTLVLVIEALCAAVAPYISTGIARRCVPSRVRGPSFAKWHRFAH